MKSIIITSYLDEKTGWGRYSLEMVSRMVGDGFEVLVVCNKKNEKFREINQLEILPDPLLFKRNHFFSFFYVLKFLFKNEEFREVDFIHCFVEPYSFFTYLISRILRVKYFITIHGSYGVKGFDRRIYKFLQLFSYKRANKIFCVSNYTKNRVLGYIKLKNISVIPNGVGDEMFCASSKQEKKNLIFSVGALKKRKGFDVTIKALKIVKDKIPEVGYNIVGSQKDKKYFDYLKELIIKLGLQENVFFHTRISDEELREFYMKSKLFVLNPISDKYNFEGFGLVYLEANACGLPVVGSYDNGGEDAIRNGYNGLLAKAEDEKDTAEKILQILENNDVYRKMSKNAIEWSDNLRWKNIFKKYLEFYCE